MALQYARFPFLSALVICCIAGLLTILLIPGRNTRAIKTVSALFSGLTLVITIYPGLLAGFYAWSKRKDKISKEEREAALAAALARADEETKQKLADAAEKAKKDKERAVEQAVKKALAEAEAAGGEEGAS